MGGVLKKYIPKLKRTFFFMGGPFSLWYSPLLLPGPKMKSLVMVWLYSPFFGKNSFFCRLTAFFMFRIFYLLLMGFAGFLFSKFSSLKKGSLYSISLWGKKGYLKGVPKEISFYQQRRWGFFFTKSIQKFMLIQEIGWGPRTSLGTKKHFFYPP